MRKQSFPTIEQTRHPFHVPPFSPSERVVILGAGATVGAKFAENATVKPPMNADFFTQLQRVGAKDKDTVEAVIADVVQLFGGNFSLTLEDYFSQLESMIDAARFGPKGAAKLTGAELRKKRERLMKALAAVLEASTDKAIRSERGCTRHLKLVNALRPRDTVISFNYDCVMDCALRLGGNGKWGARYGYAFRRPSRVLEEGDRYWSADLPAPNAASTIYLLKLHGSLNWQLPPTADGDILLKQRLHRQNGTPRFTIIPPGWSKHERDEPEFDELWKKAERALRNAKTIAVVGFSFTPTDLHVQAVVRLAIARSNSLRHLVIANPSTEDRERVRAVFSQQLGPKVIVRQYDNFKQFIGALPGCLD